MMVSFLPSLSVRRAADKRNAWAADGTAGERGHVIASSGVELESMFTDYLPHCGENHDPEIEPDGPFPDIFEIVVDTLAKIFALYKLTPGAVHLRPSGDSRFHAVAQQIIAAGRIQ